jgi:hypothetical protein
METFPNLLDWLEGESPQLQGLEPCFQKNLLTLLRSRLDANETEIQALKIAITRMLHLTFYRASPFPEFRSYRSPEEFHRAAQNLQGTIRVGRYGRLSSLCQGDPILSKIFARLER